MVTQCRLTLARVVETDVLVVGGGAAACRAAVAAMEAGARTIIALKGTLGKSGATNYGAGNRSVAGSAWQAADGCGGSEDSPEVHYQDIRLAALGMADARLAWILAHESPERLLEMASWGFALHPDPTGQRRHYAGYSCFATQPRAHGIIGSREGGHTGNMVTVLARRLLAGGATVHEQTTVIDLLVQAGACVGALAVSPDGDFVVYRAGAVVLATGGAAQMFPLNSAPGEITGDGYAMALRAGAELVNMEFMQYMLRVVRGQPPQVGGPLWVAEPTLRNALGEEALTRYLPSGVTPERVMLERTLHYPFSCRDASGWLDVAIEKEIRAGRGTAHGGLVVDFSTLDLRRLKPARPQHHPSALEMALGDRQVEIAHSAHAINGGIRVDEWGQTTVPGLYAVGETIAGPHGADRLGGGMLAACHVFGARAGIRASEHARLVGPPDRHLEALEVPEARLDGFGRGKRGDWLAIRKALKSLAAKHLVVVRNAQGLSQMLAEVARLRCEELPDVPVQDSRSLPRVLETDDLLFVAGVMARAALLRQENRGSHFREDFPTRDDERWLVNVFWRARNGEAEPLLGRFRQNPDSAVQVTPQGTTIT